jgi:hypothetical protein
MLSGSRSTLSPCGPEHPSRGYIWLRSFGAIPSISQEAAFKSTMLFSYGAGLCSEHALLTDLCEMNLPPVK